MKKLITILLTIFIVSCEDKRINHCAADLEYLENCQQYSSTAGEGGSYQFKDCCKSPGTYNLFTTKYNE